MSKLDWGFINDGGAFESLMHAILYARENEIVLFGRPGKDAGQDARSKDGKTVYQAKYRKNMNVTQLVDLALKELDQIKLYRDSDHPNYDHWKNADTWVLYANIESNPNTLSRWQSEVMPEYQNAGLNASYNGIEDIEGELIKAPQIREVFFHGANRVFIGLREAYDLLTASCIGETPLEYQFSGRETEIEVIKSFASDDTKRVLPITGPHGIGKSRLMYETLLGLSEEGWRVLWALPGSMSKSTQWFSHLNSSVKTLVVLDSPSDPELLRSVIEQLSAIERRNWRVLVSGNSTNAIGLSRYQFHDYVHEELRLPTIDKEASDELIQAILAQTIDPEFLNQVYNTTKGIPGWICLITYLLTLNKLNELPGSADQIGQVYIETSLDSLDASKRDETYRLLRAMALLGQFQIDDNTVEDWHRYLQYMGVSKTIWDESRSSLISRGLISNWGVEQRYYAVNPLLLRYALLSNWLLDQVGEAYQVSDAGKALIQHLLEGQVPFLDTVLETLTGLQHSHMGPGTSSNLLQPIFEVLTQLANEVDLKRQKRILEITKKIGPVDPEGALEILQTLIETPKESYEVTSTLWGNHAVNHSDLVSEIPWVLFELVKYVNDSSVARRFLKVYQTLYEKEENGEIEPNRGKRTSELVPRILIDQRYDRFLGSSVKLIKENFTKQESLSFTCILVGAVLNPIKESLRSVGKWEYAIRKLMIKPDTDLWRTSIEVREKVIEQLQDSNLESLKSQLWSVLTDSHHEHHRVVMSGRLNPSIKTAYELVLINDLKWCLDRLNNQQNTMNYAEATHAREMWHWYLEYGQAGELKDLATECEAAYSKLSNWRPQDFFGFETITRNDPETQRVVDAFKKVTDESELVQFFEESEAYLNASHEGGIDPSNHWRLSSLADGLATTDFFKQSPPHRIMDFMEQTLSGKTLPNNKLAKNFSIKLCQKHLLLFKRQYPDKYDELFTRYLDLAHERSRFLWGLLSNSHPDSTGDLKPVELEATLSHEASYKPHEFFFLLGQFCRVDSEKVRQIINDRLKNMEGEWDTASQCFMRFIQAVHLSSLRYAWTPDEPPVQWVFEMIQQHQLDGKILGFSDLEQLGKLANYRLTMAQTVGLIQSRIELEKIKDIPRNYDVLPVDYDLGKWCQLDASVEGELDAFNELCGLALRSSVVSIMQMPAFFPQVDPQGKYLTGFIRRYLDEHPELSHEDLGKLGRLVSRYKDDAEEWFELASPICERVENLKRSERGYVYSRMSDEGMRSFSSALGEVPELFINAYEQAERLLQNEPSDSPLIGYRQWVFDNAKAELEHERQIAEEETHE